MMLLVLLMLMHSWCDLGLDENSAECLRLVIFEIGKRDILILARLTKLSCSSRHLVGVSSGAA